mmetsp:Transcript_81394/g.140985  ORF Transcript_81394/g.140985 Transcript_81394/m.140985 type:complete len:236 (-) Transcript_81394:32-739(-)
MVFLFSQGWLTGSLKCDMPPIPTAFAPAAGGGYGALMTKGYVPPGDFNKILEMARSAAAHGTQATKAAQYSEVAAASAGTYAQRAVARAMHVGNKYESGTGFEDVLTLIRLSSAAADRAINASKYSDMLASQAGNDAAKAVSESMHLTHGSHHHGDAPFAPGNVGGEDENTAMASAPKPDLIALSAAMCLTPSRALLEVPTQRHSTSERRRSVSMQDFLSTPQTCDALMTAADGL